MEPFLDGFDSVEDVLAQYKAPPDALKDAELILAVYSYEDYSGYSFVIFRRDGKLYEVEGSHCSCHGLEGQWGEVETNIEVLKNREFYGLNHFKDKLFECLAKLD